jgi:hypothetical protein
LGVGKPLANFKLNRRSPHYWWWIAGCVAFFLAGVGALATGFYLTYAYVTEFGPGVAWKELQGWLFFGLAGLFLGAILLAGFLVYRGQSIQLFKTGLIYRHGRRKDAWRWDEIEHLYGKITRKPFSPLQSQGQHRYRLTGPPHRPLTLDDRYYQVELLVDRIQKARFHDLYAARAAAYNQNERVSFGPVSLNKAVINMNKKDFAWNEVAPGRIERGYLVFPLVGGKQAGEVRLPTEQIPDLEVLVAILTYVGSWQG